MAVDGGLLFVRRGGHLEPVDMRKITVRLSEQNSGLSSSQLQRLIDRAVAGFQNGINTTEIDDHLADCAANLAIEHPNYGVLSNRLAYAKFLRTIPRTFEEYLDIARREDLLSPEYLDLCTSNLPLIRRLLNDVPARELSYFALRTMQNGYLLQYRGKRVPFEHPRYMFLRVAFQLFRSDLGRACEFYEALVQNRFSVASPILFSCGANAHSFQCSSCFVLQVREDSVVGMYDTIKQMAVLMKNLGGIGLDVSDIRCRGAAVRGHNGSASGVVSFLGVADATSQQISQGGGKRKGALAAYLTAHHPEIFEFLCMRRVDGSEEMKARSIFYGLWISDEFMRRVRDDEAWSLMCPHACPGLNDVYGEEFTRMYRAYEQQGKYEKQVPARHLLAEIVKSMMETGMPYIMFKDNVNRRSNHRNIGTIRGSNLCSEICLHFNANETAVCTLGAVSLPSGLIAFSEEANGAALAVQRIVDGWSAELLAGEDDPFGAHLGVQFVGNVFATSRSRLLAYDLSVLRHSIKQLVRGLDNLLDMNTYSVPETKRSNMQNRPLGIGVQGLANVFAQLELPFDSPEARLLNRLIFEHIYYAAVEESVTLAQERGPYLRFAGSPMSYGELQPHMWNAHFITARTLDWPKLVENVKRHGLRNSTLTAIMPTATTAQLWNNNESIEPFTTNLFYRRVLSGQYMVVNEPLVRRVNELGIWEEVYEQILLQQGSVQNIDAIPQSTRALFKTSWELPQKVLIDMSIDRAPFIDQSQSLNIWMLDANMKKLSSMLMYAWRKGLKTGCYYLRTKPAFYASRTAIAPLEKSTAVPSVIPGNCNGGNDDSCSACSV